MSLRRVLVVVVSGLLAAVFAVSATGAAQAQSFLDALPNAQTTTAGPVSVEGGLTVSNPGNQSARVGVGASVRITATGGTAPYTFTASGLPPGFVISSNSSHAVVSGVASQAGTFAVTVNVRDSASPQNTGSTTFTYIITGGPSPCGDLIDNGGFEYGTSPWGWTSTVLGNISGQKPRTGSQYAWLDGYGEVHTDTLTQTIRIPAGCKRTLNYYLYIESAETTTTAQNDTLTVTANGTTIATFSNLNKAPGYALRTADLSAFAGQTVTLTWTGTENASLPTSFVIDDVSTS